MVVAGKDISWTKLDQFPSCQILDIDSIFNLKGIAPLQIFLDFYKQDIRVSIFVQDYLRKVSRQLNSNMLVYSGPSLASNLKHNNYKKMILKLSQIKDSIHDKQVRCTNYPNKQFKSYEDCDDNFMKIKMLSDYHLFSLWNIVKEGEVFNIPTKK